MRLELRTAVLALLTAAPLSMAPAAAPRPSDPDHAQVVVRFEDLDLSRRSDVARLYARMRYAVETLCPAPSGDVARFVRGRACQRDVLQRAVERAGIPLLAELHRDHTGGSRDRVVRR